MADFPSAVGPTQPDRGYRPCRPTALRRLSSIQGIVDGGPECGCRYGLAGPEYGK